MSGLLPFIVVGLVSGSVYGLAGMGLVLTYKTSGIFNFAHGAVAVAVAAGFYELRVLHGVAWPIALVVCVLGLGPAVGLVMERISRRMADAPPVMKIVATLGLLVGITQLAIIRYGAATRPFPAFLPTRTVHVVGVNIGVDQIIVMGVGLAAAGSLSIFFRTSRLGREMRGVVDNAELVALTGTNPTAVRRWAWSIGAAFAGLSGILIAPTIGLDANILTLLVVQAFGAAAVGLFTNLPLTYAGGLLLGVGAAVSSKYIGSVHWLAGLPPSLPFVALFTVLLVVPRRRLVDVAVERRLRPPERDERPAGAGLAVAAVGVLLLVLVPELVGTRLVVYTNGLVYFVLFLSLALLVHMSGQVSLAQLGFAAVGAATFSHLAHGVGLPWPIAVLAAGLVAVPVGAVVAIPAIRLSGLHLALATFGFGVLLERLVYPTAPMFGGRSNVLAPRPSFGASDRGYYYVALAVAALAVVLVLAVRRGRLGRFLRAMADSPLGLSTYGTNVVVLKVLVFCISAFLAGIAGALLGPVSGNTGGDVFSTFQSLQLVVVLAMLGHRRSEPLAALGAAAALAVIPSYVRSATLSEWFPVLFGVAAVTTAMLEAETTARWARLHSAATTRLARTPRRAPVEGAVA